MKMKCTCHYRGLAGGCHLELLRAANVIHLVCARGRQLERHHLLLLVAVVRLRGELEVVLLQVVPRDGNGLDRLVHGLRC